jgi:hypothetical protein
MLIKSSLLAFSLRIRGFYSDLSFNCYYLISCYMIILSIVVISVEYVLSLLRYKGPFYLLPILYLYINSSIVYTRVHLHITFTYTSIFLVLYFFILKF